MSQQVGQKAVTVVAVCVAVVAAAVAAVVVSVNRAKEARAYAELEIATADAADAQAKEARAQADAETEKRRAAEASAKAKADELAAQKLARETAEEEAKATDANKAAAEANARAESAKAEAARAARDEARAKAEAARAEQEKARQTALAESAKAEAEASRLATEKVKSEKVIAEAELRKRDYAMLVQWQQQLDERERDVAERELALQPEKVITDLAWAGGMEDRVFDGNGNVTNRVKVAYDPAKDLSLPAETRRLAQVERQTSESHSNLVATTRASVIAPLERLYVQALRENRVVDAAYYKKSILSMDPDWKFQSPAAAR